MDTSFYKNLVCRDDFAEHLGCNYKTVANLEDKGLLQRITLPWSSKVWYRKSACERLLKVVTDNNDVSATTLDGLRYAVIIEAFNVLTKCDPDEGALRVSLASELANSKSSLTADSVAEFIYSKRNEIQKLRAAVVPKVDTKPVVETPKPPTDETEDDDEPSVDISEELGAMVGKVDDDEPKIEPIEELYFGHKPKAKTAE